MFAIKLLFQQIKVLRFIAVLFSKPLPLTSEAQAFQGRKNDIISAIDSFLYISLKIC